MISLPLSREVLNSEVDTALAVLTHVKQQLSELPGLDTPGSPEALASVLYEAAGDLAVVASKCQTLTAVLTERHTG